MRNVANFVGVLAVAASSSFVCVQIDRHGRERHVTSSPSAVKRVAFAPCGNTCEYKYVEGVWTRVGLGNCTSPCGCPQYMTGGNMACTANDDGTVTHTCFNAAEMRAAHASRDEPGSTELAGSGRTAIGNDPVDGTKTGR